tara:strand:+ start:108 stop:485 length:378 start_codon:yes stop_codon:yes gene_type:complete
MAFKLNRYKPLPGIARNGELNKKLNIKRKDLEKGVVAEAINESEIVVDKNVPRDSKLYKEAIAHEKVHCEEMASGRIAYGDDWVRSDGKTYPRKDGKIKYNGKWYPEGDKVFPWEKRAMKAEKNV